MPVNIPPKKQQAFDLETAITANTQNDKCGNKEILIHIDKDENKNKECLKKLFKKVHKLTDDLAASEKERVRLELEL